MTDTELQEAVEWQIEMQGVSVITVSDGTVLTFTRSMLEKLLAASLDSGRAVVFIKKGEKV